MEPIEFSPQYTFVRGRQLEGTFPGDRETGIWPITGGRISYGWGAVPEEIWPYDTSVWPPIEPPDVDTVAKQYWGGRYQRVRTLAECKVVLGSQQHPLLVGVSFEITDKWFNALGGRIPRLLPADKVIGSHYVVLFGYDDHTGEFAFRNSWGARWGDKGNGTITYDTFNETWIEGWLQDIPLHWYAPPLDIVELGEQHGGAAQYAWEVSEHGGGVFHCREFVHATFGRIAWAFAIERPGGLEVEELFVRPEFRTKTYGRRLLQSLVELAAGQGIPLRIWISFADSNNVEAIKRLITPFGLLLRSSGVRWSALGASSSQALAIDTSSPAEVPARPVSIYLKSS